MSESPAQSAAASAVERLILERFRERTHSAGGPKAGYVLRREAVRQKHPDVPEPDLAAAFDALLARGLVAANEDSPVVFLTEAGAEAVRSLGS